ncbi:tyrosine-type recombinase/integrase [Glutamicibacter sp. MNS18]|uniref:tyrosine-type recombinase/integrase n=1 Tax=Glutamicibacter sp. MNS18 TaxID=2989817 RepID=UPI002235BFE8|nr:tyrosine-type recombinase/integrase [Glutamicibacter sp. MNS18]MCW4464632.1 tyrosine-type recombinase/integrase [Glutamicibacter sp. MNS18]
MGDIEQANATHERAALIGQWLAAYLDSNGTEGNTFKAYRANAQRFTRWLDSTGLDLLAVTRSDMDMYRYSLSGQGLSAATVSRHLTALSSLYTYLTDEGKAEGNPVARVRRPVVSADASTTQGLTVEQAKALVSAAHKHSPRAYALIVLLLNTGIRISEALEAHASDLGHDSGHRVLNVTRKGGTRQKIALNPSVIHALAGYLGEGIATGTDLEAATNDAKGAPLFATRTGKPWARSEAFRLIQSLATKAGIPGKVSPHSLRHTFATVALDRDVPLHALQDSMGHADPRTTRRYDRARNNLNKAAGYALNGVFDDK